MKLEVTTSSKTSFMLAELLKVGLLATLREILWNFALLNAVVTFLHRDERDVHSVPQVE